MNLARRLNKSVPEIYTRGELFCRQIRKARQYGY